MKIQIDQEDKKIILDALHGERNEAEYDLNGAKIRKNDKCDMFPESHQNACVNVRLFKERLDKLAAIIKKIEVAK